MLRKSTCHILTILSSDLTLATASSKESNWHNCWCHSYTSKHSKPWACTHPCTTHPLRPSNPSLKTWPQPYPPTYQNWKWGWQIHRFRGNIYVVDTTSYHNTIMSWPWQRTIGGILSTHYQVMKFLSPNGVSIMELHGDYIKANFDNFTICKSSGVIPLTSTT